MEPWMQDGTVGFAVGLVLYILRLLGITFPYLSNWNAANLSLGAVGVTMVVAYTIIGIFIGELIEQTTGIKRKRKK